MVSRQQRVLTLVMVAGVCAWAEQGKPKFRTDDPLLTEPKPREVRQMRRRSVDDVYDFAYHSFATPKVVAEEAREGQAKPAGDINTLGEVPDGDWYTMRHYRRRMSLDELKRGPGNSTPPAEGRWRVVAAKSDGVTPGFTIEDAQGHRYLLKLDPVDYPELASGADMIGSKLFYALGYWTPENYVVRFPLDRLEVDPSATVVSAGGRTIRLTQGRIQRLLREQRKDENGHYRALASRLISGESVGPFRYTGTRSDDPNDIVRHENRRSLRGLAVFAAWFNHTDARAINSLDVITEDNGRRRVRHYLIDFGSSMGSDSVFPKEASRGHVYDIEPKAIGKQIVTLGLLVPDWQRSRVPHLTGVGRFEATSFDARTWKPAYPNPAFMRMDEADAFWAARQVGSFTDEEILALVQTAEYSDPRATEYVAQTLSARRDKIRTAYLSGPLAQDRFRVVNGELAFDDLATERAATRPFISWARYDNSTGHLEHWPSASGNRIPAEADALREGQYCRASLRPEGARDAVTPAIDVYLRRGQDGWQVVGIDRMHSAAPSAAEANAKAAALNAPGKSQ